MSDSAPHRIWCLLHDQFSHVEPLRGYFGVGAEFHIDQEWNAEAMLRTRPSLVLSVNDYQHGIAECILAANEAGIPTLCLQDGILEWRCQYENPLFGAGGGAPQHQPVLCRKIACIGAQSARQITAWGNGGKVEVCGLPRIDHLLERPPAPLQRPGRRILVMTAKKPGFTPQQVEVTLASLRDVQRHLSGLQGIEVLWRTRDEVASQLGVDNRFQQASSAELAELLDRVDAVITTPSTAMLEAMLRKRPVAVLDYHNAPRFVPSAWTISAPSHIAPAVDELLSPPARKMAFQEDCLHDALCCHGPAAARVADLMERMIRGDMSETVTVFRSNHAEFSLADIYPEQPAFQESDVALLHGRLARLQQQNHTLRTALEQRTAGAVLLSAARRVSALFHASGFNVSGRRSA